MTPAEREAIAQPRALVVDDEIEVRFLLAEHFRAAGFVVAEAYNADEAITLLGCSTFDVVVTDVQMPGSTDGLGLARTVQTSFPRMLVVVVSGLDLSCQLRETGVAFFPKPYSSSSLIDHVKTGLTSR